ncbi:MAG TPA: hypothetical protein VHH34_00565 [Pseudonocardiaceae bacterium]|nr:hypothetical protein [Pseudonocardiaceae bacterium]
MVYHADVEFLDECSPALIERNAAEFGRTRDLLVSAEPSVHRARHDTVWESVHRQNFDARLSDVGRLLTGLAEGLGSATPTRWRPPGGTWLRAYMPSTPSAA